MKKVPSKDVKPTPATPKKVPHNLAGTHRGKK